MWKGRGLRKGSKVKEEARMRGRSLGGQWGRGWGGARLRGEAVLTRGAGDRTNV